MGFNPRGGFSPNFQRPLEAKLYAMCEEFSRFKNGPLPFLPPLSPYPCPSLPVIDYWLTDGGMETVQIEENSSVFSLIWMC